MSANEGKTRFRKYTASIMAAGIISALLYGWLTGVIDTASTGLDGGVIIDLGALVYYFTVGYKVVAGKIIKLNVVTNDSCEIKSIVECFEKTTGETSVI